jgi:hypothetical protein
MQYFAPPNVVTMPRPERLVSNQPIAESWRVHRFSKEDLMTRPILLAVLLSLAPAMAFANSCPSQMAAIDAALPTASLSEADMAKVKELRKQGEDLHNAGDHAGSEAALGQAKKMLGI